MRVYLRLPVMVAAALSWVLACDAALAESREEEEKKSAEWMVWWMAPWDREVKQQERERAAALWQQAQAHMAAQLAAEGLRTLGGGR